MEQEIQLISQLGQAAGMVGIALGIFFLIGRRAIKSLGDAPITPSDRYKIAKLVVVLAYRLAVLCLAAGVASFALDLLVRVFLNMK